MNYYNEHDPKAAAWLRVLICEGHIAPGDVDERSIVDVKPTDLAGYVQCHFFAGIGGWSLALRLAGWPDDKPAWTGSCPCQPFSVAGKGLGEADERHLWPEFKRLIAERQPSVCFGEQVASADGRNWLAGVRADLEGMAYRVGAADLCAAGTGEEGEGWVVRGDCIERERIVIGAPHIRQRLYWVAESRSQSARRRVCRPGEGVEASGERTPDQLGGPSGSRGLAESAGVERGVRGAESGGDASAQRADVAESGRAGWMGEPIQPGLEGQSGAGGGGHQPGRLEAQPHRPVAAPGAVGGVVQPNGAGRDAGKSSAEAARYGSAVESAGSWSRFNILPCRDGKARRVESGTFPLAHGVPGRVGLLRGYGNAIVPQLAAEFIQAYQETLTHE